MDHLSLGGRHLATTQQQVLCRTQRHLASHQHLGHRHQVHLDLLGNQGVYLEQELLVPRPLVPAIRQMPVRLERLLTVGPRSTSLRIVRTPVETELYANSSLKGAADLATTAGSRTTRVVAAEGVLARIAVLLAVVVKITHLEAAITPLEPTRHLVDLDDDSYCS